MQFRQINPKDIKTLRQGLENACVHIDSVAEMHEFDKAGDSDPLKMRHYLGPEKAADANMLREKFIEDLHHHLRQFSKEKAARTPEEENMEGAVRATIEKASVGDWASYLEVMEMRDFVREMLKEKAEK